MHVSWVGRETGYCSIFEPKMNSATEMISVPLRRLDGQQNFPSHLLLDCAHNIFGHKQFISEEKMQKKMLGLKFHFFTYEQSSLFTGDCYSL